MAKKRAKQPRLPGTEGGIAELEQLGYEYASLRDQRMELTRQEVDLKKKTVDAMHRHSITEYKYQDLEMKLVPGEEKLKVVVEKDTDGEAA